MDVIYIYICFPVLSGSQQAECCIFMESRGGRARGREGAGGSSADTHTDSGSRSQASLRVPASPGRGSARARGRAHRWRGGVCKDSSHVLLLIFSTCLFQDQYYIPICKTGIGRKGEEKRAEEWSMEFITDI